jgi:hypothetical protein
MVSYHQGNVQQFIIISSTIIVVSGGIGLLLESKRPFWTSLFEKTFFKLQIKANYDK